MYLRNRRTKGAKFRRQYSVDQYIIDFYSPQYKLAIEIDGSIHDATDHILYDLERQKYLEYYGIKFIRIKNEEIFKNADKAFKKIEAFLDESEQKKSGSK